MNEVKKIKISTKKVSDLQDQVFALNLQNAEIMAAKVPSDHHQKDRDNQTRNTPTKRIKNYEKQPYLQNPRSSSQPRNKDRTDSRNKSDNSGVILVRAEDGRYSQFVDQIKDSQHFKYVGQKIKHDYFTSSPELRRELNQIRANKPRNKPVYEWIGNKYRVSRKNQFKFPVFKKRGTNTPDLTPEALKHFAEVCYSCGIPNCPGKHDPACIYHSRPDSWFLCTNCETGLHLSKDCLALVEN
jgi:hypothetical protein